MNGAIVAIKWEQEVLLQYRAAVAASLHLLVTSIQAPFHFLHHSSLHKFTYIIDETKRGGSVSVNYKWHERRRRHTHTKKEKARQC